MKCTGVFSAHDGDAPVRRYRVLTNGDIVELCDPCGAEAMDRTGHIVLEKRADPNRPDRGRRWSLGPIGRRRAA